VKFQETQISPQKLHPKTHNIHSFTVLKVKKFKEVKISAKKLHLEIHYIHPSTDLEVKN
jgi:hypothetical protein